MRFSVDPRSSQRPCIYIYCALIQAAKHFKGPGVQMTMWNFQDYFRRQLMLLQCKMAVRNRHYRTFILFFLFYFLFFDSLHLTFLIFFFLNFKIIVGQFHNDLSTFPNPQSSKNWRILFVCLFDAKTHWSAKSDTNGSEAICNFYLPYLVWIAIWFAIDLSIWKKNITLDSDEYY